MRLDDLDILRIPLCFGGMSVDLEELHAMVLETFLNRHLLKLGISHCAVDLKFYDCR
jgi:hypothetical protein